MSEFSEPPVPDFAVELDPILKSCLDRLGEHTDSALIIVTRHDAVKDQTWSITRSRGNSLANQGAAAEYIAKKNEWARCEERDDHNKQS